jgi:hypothetical protein
MPQNPFPDPGPDDAEPGGFPSAEDGPGLGQGLYVTLPAEQLTLAGFCQGGASDTMAPGALLATVVHTVTGDDGSGLAGLSEDQLLGIISAARRLESRTAWTLMAAVGEFARRAGAGLEGEFAADELASELHMSQQSAAGQMEFASSVATRLPQTFAALAAGQIHPVHLRVIEEETRKGRSDTPGDADGFGLVDADDARDLAAAAARHARTRWCVTALNPDGTAAAHGCVPGRHPPPCRANLTVTSSPALGPGPPPGTRPQDDLRRLGIDMVPVTRGSCDHAQAEAGYRPSRALRHLVNARNARCTAPGCGRPAARCDLDHTVPWDQGGITCECDLAPLCRHHHRCKQAEGWSLDQPEPGVLVWRTPSGRTYATSPAVYPI